MQNPSIMEIRFSIKLIDIEFVNVAICLIDR